MQCERWPVRHRAPVQPSGFAWTRGTPASFASSSLAHRDFCAIRADTAAACRAGDHDADRWHRPVATAKPDARLIKLLIRARRFNATLLDSDGVPFAALAKRQGVSRSYFTRLVRLSYLAPDITEAILDGRQPHDLTADKLLAHSRLPLGWHEQRTVLGFA
jgi:site-specific DNA recombinase